MKKLFGLLLFISMTACTSTQKKTSYVQSPSENKSILVDQYYIGVDDVVTVSVWKEPDLSITVPVRPDGKISVPLAGEIMAGGKAPLDVAEAITEKLKNYIRDPKVSVILDQLRSHEYLSRIRVTGAVQNPLSMNYRQGMTVLDIVLEAGGLNEFASANATKLFRRNAGSTEAINIYLSDILYDGDMDTNIAVQPGDILSIPERTF